MKKSVLKQYARLIAVMGAGVREGQEVVLRAGLDQPEFVYLLTEECYRAGAARVTVEWSDPSLDRLHYGYQSTERLGRMEDWELAKLAWKRDTLPCHIYLESDDPDGLRGIDQGKMAQARQARYGLTKPYTDAMEGRYQWCIAAVPGAAWAKQVFPELGRRQAVERLWEAILAASRVDGDPIAAWEAHNRDLKARCAYLNELNAEALEYRAGNGTRLRVGLMPEGRFCGGEETALGSGARFNPNIPSEECFTSPKAGQAEGVVYATKPLSYQGQLIEGFWFRFENGRVTDCGAEKNQELLRQMVAMDEGAARLGECALVPFDSPINRSGLLFRNTLFDENACCHLALGMGFIDCVRDYENRTLEEMRALGVNESMIHTDFMIGTEDLAVTALCAGGRRVPVFRDGGWAF